MITIVIALAMQTVGGPLPRVEHTLLGGVTAGSMPATDPTYPTETVSVRNDAPREMTVEFVDRGVRSVLHVAAHDSGELRMPDGLVSLRVAPAAPEGAVAVASTRVSSFLMPGRALMVIDAAGRATMVRIDDH